MLGATREAKAAEQGFRKVLNADHMVTPRVMTVGQRAAYPPAFEALQQAELLPETRLLRPCKYWNDIIEQDHWFVKRRVSPGVGFGAFSTAHNAARDRNGVVTTAGRAETTGGILGAPQSSSLRRLIRVRTGRGLSSSRLEHFWGD